MSIELFIQYLCVGAVVSKLVEDERVDEAHISSHLLHPPQLPFLLRVGKLDDQT